MADNYVQIRIKATDTAKPDLDSLRADLDELGTKVDTAKVDVDDRDAKLKLLQLNAELAALKKRTNMNLDSSGAARAESRIEKLKGDVDDLIHKVDDSNSSSGGRGLLGKLLLGAGGEGGSGGSGTSGLLGGLKDVLPFGGSPVALAGIAGAIAAALTEVDALASGFAAAGAGAGAFAILALPAFDKVKGALKDTHAQLMKLDPDERGAVEGIKGLEHSLGRMSKAFEPEAFKVFNSALKVANELLPHLAPFADIFANGLNSLLKQAGKFADSKGFREWLKQFKGLEGGSLHAIGEGLGHVVTNFGKLFTIMSKKDVVNGINIAFSILDGTLIGLRGVIKITMGVFDAFNGAMKWCGRVVDDLVHVIASGFDRARHDIASWAADVGRDTMRVVSFFRALPGRIMGALSSLGGELFSFGAHIIEQLASGILSAIGSVTSAIGSIAGDILDHIPHSPAKKGPLSGSGDPRLGGKRIAQMLAEGLTDGVSGVSAAADRVAGGAVMGGRGGRGGGGTLKIELQWVGGQSDAQFMTWLQRNIRARGGSPGIIQNKVVFQ